MPGAKGSKGGFYAVARGRVPGIYESWSECESQVKGFSGAMHKCFFERREAETFVDSNSRPKENFTMSSSDLINQLSAMRLDAESEEGYDVVYSEGVCKRNGYGGSFAGIGFWWGPSDPRNMSERCPGAQTNNRAELIAIIRILEETRVSEPPIPLIIKTDSEYSINSAGKWSQDWAARDWIRASGKPVLNVSIIRYLLAPIAYRRARGSLVELVHVKGDAKIEGNEGAYTLANEGAWLGVVGECDWEQERLRVEGLIKQLESKD